MLHGTVFILKWSTEILECNLTKSSQSICRVSTVNLETYLVVQGLQAYNLTSVTQIRETVHSIFRHKNKNKKCAAGPFFLLPSTAT